MAEALRQSLGSGPEVTANTLKKMVQLVRKYKADLTVLRTARAQTQGVDGRNTRGVVDVLQRWVRDNIRYVMDPRGLEMVQTPVETLRIATGDCDDKSVLLAALLTSMGYATGFCAMGFQGQSFSHVIALVRMGQGWCPLETIIPGMGMGWSPPDATSRMAVYV